MDKKRLEELSKKLIVWELEKKDFPEFENIKEYSKCINYLIENKYVVNFKKNLFKKDYITEKGKNWANNHFPETLPNLFD